jgi:hypothetical protein
MADFHVFSKIPEHRLPSNPETRTNIEHVKEHGYVILKNCFTEAEADEAIREMDRLSGAAPKEGRNVFEGFRTNRIYSLLNK